MKKQQVRIIGIAAALAAVAAGTYLIIQYWTKSNEGKPSKKAPQTPLQNPGDQSEFTTAASPSEMG